MSVQMNTYVIAGLSYDYDEFHDIFGNDDIDVYNIIEPFLDSAFEGIRHHNGLCIISDGMNGDYVLVGRVLAKTGNFEGYESSLPIKIDISEREKDLIAGTINSNFDNLEVNKDDINIFTISHYR